MNTPFDPREVLDGLVDPVVVLNRAEVIVYANQKVERISGAHVSLIVGKRFADALPAVSGIIDHARYLHAIGTGECLSFEHVFPAITRRYEIVVQLLGGEWISLLFREVLARSPEPADPIDVHRHHEHPHASLHSRMLAHMGTCLRADLGAAETFYQMACILGQLPNVSRATFGTVDHESRSITIHRDYCKNVPSMAGTYPMSDAEITSQELGRGQNIVITDVRTDYRSRDGAARRFKLGYLACVAIPLMRDNVWTATLMVHSPVPRVWSPEEVELIQTAAERTWLAVENARLLQEARYANAAKDRFLAMLSHELRTPLTPVVMMLSALQMSDQVSPQTKNDLALIRRNIDLETRLIDDLLDITRIANGKLQLSFRPCRVHELLEHVCQICAGDAQNGGIELGCQLGPGCDAVDGDPARLEQVFWNLIKNAIKFTPAGGRVWVSTETSEQELLLTVRDQGVGIAPEFLSHIFNAFEQGEKAVTRTFGGLGLGLAISKAIVDLHGGRISAQSDGLNCGATFCVALPLRVSFTGIARDAKPGEEGLAEVGRIKSLRVLLVDDNADTVGTMERLLTFRGMQVTTAAGMKAALSAASTTKFDLMISDIGLPDGSGCELVRTMRNSQSFPAIALSGYGTEADVQRSLAAGFTAHLVKPVGLEELEKAIFAIT